MDKDKKKKSGRCKAKRQTFRKRSVNGGMLGGGRPWMPPPLMPRRDYRYNNEQKHTPKQEKSHWNGKAEIWTEPQKPRQEKIVKYEVDTDKLLRELAKGNKDALNEIAERIEGEAKAEPAEEAEPRKADTAETNELEKKEASDKTELETTKQTDESSEQTETDMQDKESTEKSENATETNEDIETEPQPENTEDQSIESETESSQQEDPLDAPELVYMNPSFWEQLESEMSDELEQLEPEEEMEIEPEESEPIEEDY